MNNGIRSLALCSTALACGWVQAAYPDRAITMIVPFSAGAGTDITARNMAQCMEAQLKGPAIVVLNRPGAAGDIGLGALASSAPDGYTIGIVNTPGIVSVPIERATKWNLDSFELLGNVADSPATISVHADSAIHSVADLVKAAKAAPGQWSIGTQGSGSAGHIATLMLEKSAGIQLLPVPFQGTAPARTALLGKIVEGTTANIDEASSYRNGSPWRILGVMSDSRASVAADVPTFKEAGYDVLGGSMRAFAAPKGLPAEVSAKLVASVKTCAADPTFRERSTKSYLPIRYMSPQDLHKNLRQLDASLRELWKTKPWTQ